MLMNEPTGRTVGGRYRGQVPLADFMSGQVAVKPKQAGSGRIRWKRRQVISPRYYFNLYRGGALRDLFDLYSALSRIDEEQFGHHSNPDRNDFADWVEVVFGERSVAEDMRQAGSREAMRGCLERCLYL